MTQHFIPNPFALSGFLLGITCTILLAILLIFGRTNLHRIWTFFNISVLIWGYSAYFIARLDSADHALALWRISMVGAIFIPVLFYHFCCSFAGVDRRKFLTFVYGQGIFFLFITFFTNLFELKIKLLWGSIFYIHSNALIFLIFTLIWGALVVLGNYELLTQYKNFRGTKRSQALYLFVGFLIGFVGGSMCFFPMFGWEIYPYGNFTISLYCIFSSYAVLRYRLLDLKVAFTRTGVFIAVYSSILGIPFAIALGLNKPLHSYFGENWWFVPLISSTILATVGPSIYFYIQKRAEDKLLSEQRQYQTTLRQASLGMGRVKDLKRLLNLIVHIVVRAVKIQHCEIYLLHEDSRQFVLRATKGNWPNKKSASMIPVNSVFIQYLEKIKEPVVYEEIRQKAQDYRDAGLVELEKYLNGLDAALAVPSFIEERLIAIIILGKKLSGKLYSQDDMSVFSILANQSALAIENAQFYDDMKKTHEQLFKAEKMATIGTMADGLSHQINNRLHAMGFIAGDALDSIRLKKNDSVPADTKSLLADIEHALVRIEENIKRGGEIVEGLLKYTRKGEEGFSAIDLNKLVNAAIEMVQFKIKLNEMDIVRKFNKDFPKVKGNFTQLQEVVFNIIDNSFDAIMQRKVEMKEPDFRGQLEINAISIGQDIEFIFQDNGMGVKKDDVHKLFTPFFTTKLSSKKGTGLGLYVIRQIVEENHGGKVIFTSEYQKGAQTKLLLPAYLSENKKNS